MKVPVRTDFSRSRAFRAAAVSDMGGRESAKGEVPSAKLGPMARRSAPDDFNPSFGGTSCRGFSGRIGSTACLDLRHGGGDDTRRRRFPGEALVQRDARLFRGGGGQPARNDGDALLGEGRVAGADGGSEAGIAAAHQFLQKIQLATLVGQGVLMIGCLGFFITGGNWLIAMKRRKAGRLG